ncbi:MAG: hypothetical protein FWE95_00210 [Planctomycetaceae bacterium]|nr:hypothetical protein [Planctomycetaceae bacterium]
MRESHELQIAFVSLASDDPNYGTFVIHNTGDAPIRIDAIRITNTESGEEMPANLLKLTNRAVVPNGWELGVFQIGRQFSGHAPVLRVEYELNKKRYFTIRPLEPTHVWTKSIRVNEDFSSVFKYVVLEEHISQEAVSVTINGNEAIVSDYSILPTEDGHFFVCLKIAPPRKLSEGERLFVSATWDDKIIYGGCMKVFYSFVAGRTQYEKTMRPVDLEFTANSITLNIYNEADFRKCPTVIERVLLNGVDVTAQTIFPSEPFPPDLHDYKGDVRPVAVRNISINDGNRHRFDFDFRRLEPLRSGHTIPDGYFDMQSFSCIVQHGIPYEIDGENGLPGGVCTFYGGLRNRPEILEFIRRYNSVVSVDPSIPVYIYPHEGTRPTTVYQLAGCSDFITTGLTPPLIPSEFEKHRKFYDHVRFMRHLPTPWASSVLLDNDFHPSPKDLEWMTWGAIGAGSHGIFLTAHEKGDQETIEACGRGVVEILDNVRSLKPILGITKPIDLAHSFNQEGVYVNFLASGTDHLLVIILNEWSTRSAFQESEPFMAAVRKDVELGITIGADWTPTVAVDPIHRRTIPFTESHDEIALQLPQFDNVQVVLLSRKKIEETLPGFQIDDTGTQTEPLFVFLDNPVIPLGTIRPGSTHTVEVPIQSRADVSLLLSGADASNAGSKPGEVQISDVTLAPRAKGSLPIHFTATGSSGKSVTHIRYTSPDHPDIEFSVYICAEVRQPAELSPVMIDFGFLPVGSISNPREVRMRSADAGTVISSVIADNDVIKNIVIAADKQSFQFAVFSDEVGAFAAQLTVDMLVDGGEEVFTQTVRSTGQFRPTIFALPPQVSVVMADQTRTFTVAIRHVANTPIRITSFSGSEAVQCRALSDNFNREQSVELTILPSILETGGAEVEVTGVVEGGKTFSLTIPVSAFSTR